MFDKVCFLANLACESLAFSGLHLCFLARLSCGAISDNGQFAGWREDIFFFGYLFVY
jgi:hypothetical protein